MRWFMRSRSGDAMIERQERTALLSTDGGMTFDRGDTESGDALAVAARHLRVAYAAGGRSALWSRGYRAAYAGSGWVLFLGNMAVIIWLWLHNGGVSGIHGTADLVTSLGRITGLLGAYLLLIQLLLFARLPWFVRHVGIDRLIVWHRRNGKICIGLILAHVVLITIGYAQSDHLSVLAQVASFLSSSSYPGMVRATIGTALLVLVVVTSLIIVRRRLRYEAWYLVHLAAYAAVLLAWYHQLPTGNEFILSPTAAAYWTALYLVTLALLVLFRVSRPLLRAFWYRLRVAEVTVESPTVVSLRMTGRRLDRLHARAGQFFLFRFLTPGRWWTSHPFSLSEAPDGQSLRITIKYAGDFTRHIGEIAPGTRVIAEGPLGLFTDAARRRARVALIAGGIGITPIRALLEEMSGDLVVIYRVTRDDDVLFRDELEELAREGGARLCYVIGDHRAPGNEHLLSPAHLCEIVPDLSARDVYLCGPPAMMDVIERSVQAIGVPRTHIHSERFAV
jgi:predicted ferric reductase